MTTIEIISDVFRVDIVRQAQRLGLVRGKDEPWGGWYDRVRRRALMVAIERHREEDGRR